MRSLLNNAVAASARPYPDQQLIYLDAGLHRVTATTLEQGVDVGEANVEQQNQQQSNDENNLNSANDRASLSTSQDEGDHTVEHTLSAKLFDSSATGVDYYA